MPYAALLARPQHRLQLSTARPLSRPETIALLVIVTGGVIVDAVSIFTAGEINFLRALLSIITTLTFALYVWSPLAGTISLGVAVALSFIIGNAAVGLLAGAIAALLVLRLAGTALAIAYTGGLLLAMALYAFGVGVSAEDSVNVAVYLIVATFAGGLGLALRLAYARGTRLEVELAEQAERERQAVIAERRWIAGELHDSIAHHLTVVAMHAQLLDIDEARVESQDAIRTAARKALSDLRFVISLAEDAPALADSGIGNLSAAVDEAREEIEATGRCVIIEGDPADERITRGAEIVLSRIIRESATNIIKYAGDGPVRLTLRMLPEELQMTIRSPRATTPREVISSSGTGLNRMAERVLGLSGTFHAGPDGDDWLVSVQLPMVGSLEAEADAAEPLHAEADAETD